MKFITVLILFAIAAFQLFPQEQKNVLVEVFTNSHCPLCPNAHNTFNSFLNLNPTANNVDYIFYHMVYPYPDDALYLQSAFDSDARDDYYNIIPSTPRGFFDGVLQGTVSYWIDSLNVLTQNESPLIINLSGSKSENLFSINAELTRTGNIIDNDLMMHFVVVEDLFYQGRNSISHHKHVMRKMLPNPSGYPFSINLNETLNLNQQINLDPIWDADSLSFVVFVQSDSSKKIYQSGTIAYNDLIPTEEINDVGPPAEFSLYQNYPNPFNPNTSIGFKLSKEEFTILKVYNVLGHEVATLISANLPKGKYSINFDAAGLSSGIYFYTLQSGKNRLTKKMILLK